MNHQVNYIIQGFMLALLIPFGIFVFDKALKTESISNSSSIVVDQEIKPKEIVLSGAAAKGKILFRQKCAACHQLYKNGTGPSIIGFEQRGPWGDRKNLYEWIRNPAAFMQKNDYARQLKETYGAMMTAFPELTDEEIDNIVAYINYEGEVAYSGF